jgi:hypothetical protein
MVAFGADIGLATGEGLACGAGLIGRTALGLGNVDVKVSGVDEGVGESVVSGLGSTDGMALASGDAVALGEEETLLAGA